MSHPDPLDREERQLRRRRLGGIVLAIGALLAVAGVMAWPDWVRSRMNGNESAAIATLKNLSSAQSQLQASGAQDANGNGSGEYGFFGELSGAAPLRNAEPAQRVRLTPPVLSAAFQRVEQGRVHRGGYVFELWLPAVGGGWISERELAAGRQVDADAAETLWMCYAWPESPGSTGVRSFLVNHSGDILMARGDAGFSCTSAPVPERSGFVPTPTGWAVSVNTVDCHGDPWTVV